MENRENRDHKWIGNITLSTILITLSAHLKLISVLLWELFDVAIKIGVMWIVLKSIWQ